ncbi:MAG TPA: hypothetical protein VG938_05795 [Verrucomicrobiae bacterium]|nr:hypothetical protein [Verrucomicrobiae bacterium]
MNVNHIGEAQRADSCRERLLGIASPARKVNGIFTAIVFDGGFAYIPAYIVTFGKKSLNDVQIFFETVSESFAERHICPLF